MAQLVKKLPANAGDARDSRLIPGSGRSPGEENGSPLQYSCLENPMDRGAWWATVHGAAKSRPQLSNSEFHFHKAFKPEHIHMKTWYVLCTWQLCRYHKCLSYLGWRRTHAGLVVASMQESMPNSINPSQNNYRRRRQFDLFLSIWNFDPCCYEMLFNTIWPQSSFLR